MKTHRLLEVKVTALAVGLLVPGLAAAQVVEPATAPVEGPAAAPTAAPTDRPVVVPGTNVPESTSTSTAGAPAPTTSSPPSVPAAEVEAAPVEVRPLPVERVQPVRAAAVDDDGVAPPSALPPPRSDNDPRPPVAATPLPHTGVTKQAGIGGTQAYGRAGVLELGGFAGFGAAGGLTRVDVAPTIGLFVADALELSLLGQFSHFRVDGDGTLGTADVRATELKLLLEPSVHLPFSPAVFGFFGVGGGLSYFTGEGAGFAVQPRVGLNVMVGRSGVLTPSFSLAYSTVDAIRTPSGTVLAVNTSYGMNIGYTVMW